MQDIWALWVKLGEKKFNPSEKRADIQENEKKK